MKLSDMLAALAAAALAGTGVGGGGLYVIWLTAVVGMKQANAQALNLLFFIAAASAALPYHVRHRKINFALSATSAVFGIVGAVFGGLLRGVMSEGASRVTFGVFLVTSGLLSLFRRKKKSKASPQKR